MVIITHGQILYSCSMSSIVRVPNICIYIYIYSSNKQLSSRFGLEGAKGLDEGITRAFPRGANQTRAF